MVSTDRCTAPGCTTRAVHAHHVILQQEIKRRGGDPDDPRWLMRLCFRCHFEHHHPGLRDDRRLPLTSVPSAAVDAAGELLGPYAYDYLRRAYRGEDPRVDALLEAAA